MARKTLEKPATRKADSFLSITVACGDGIGPEIMKATLRVLQAAEVPIDPQVIEIGEKV
jgi:isocitrate dehydrogenase